MSTNRKVFSECACDAWYIPTLQDSIAIAHESLQLTTISHKLLHES